MSRIVPISEIAEISPSFPKGLKLSQDALVSFLPMAAVSENGNIIAQDERRLGEVSKGYTYFANGDVLMAKITPCMENGKATFVQNLRHPVGFGSTEFHVLRPSPEVDGKYLFYMIWNPMFRNVAERNMTGTAGQKRVPSSFIKDFKIPLPSLAEQKRIAAILDKADSIRRKRQEAVRLTEDLLRSVFLDMFGDPVTNPKGWETGVLGDVIFSAKDGPHVSPEYSKDGIPFLSARHVKPGRIEWNDLKHITTEEAKIHWKKCKPENGDILYTKGGTTGVAAVFDSDKEIAVWVHIALLKLNHSKVNSYWLENMLNSKYCYDQSQRYTHGITNQDLGLKRMVNIEMYLPPLSEQNKFHAAVKKIKNLASMNATYLQESENGFNSLLQNFFRM